MQQPKRTKYRKSMTGTQKGLATSGFMLAHGSFGLKAMTSGFLTAREIEAARKTIAHALHRGGKVWIRIFPDKPVTKKPLETRMGKGKGAPEFWVAVVKPGRVLFEVSGVTKELAFEALQIASHKLPIKVKVVTRPDIEQ